MLRATLRSFSIKRNADLVTSSVYQKRKTGRFPESWSVDLLCCFHLASVKWIALIGAVPVCR